MASLSKYFYKATSRCMCNDLLHGQSKNCFDSTIWNFTKIIAGCCKFVLPIAITPVLMKIRHLNLDICKQSAKIFFEYSFASWVMGGCTLSFMCLFYQIFGTFYYLTLIALPAFCSSLICAIFLSNQLIAMFGHGLFCVMMEVFMRNGATTLFRSLKESKIKRTLTFMIINVALMNLLKTSKSQGFWFLQPVRKSTDIIKTNSVDKEVIKLIQKKCSHNDSCDTHIIQEIGKFLKLGFSIEIVKAILGNIKEIRTNPLKLYKYIDRSCSLPAFLVSYSGIYRIFCCMFNRNDCSDHWYINDSLAAFLCGIAYFLYPNPGLLCHATALTIKLIWSNYILNASSASTLNRTSPSKWHQLFNYHKIIHLLKRIPIARFFYPIAFGYLLHIRVFYPWLAPAVLQKLMNLTTGGKDAQLLTNFYPILFGGEKSPETTLYLFNLNK